jgi:hypothetical protein
MKANSRIFDVPCTIEIEQTPESLHAHVDLDGDIDIHPGDRVLIHDAPVEVAYGERVVVRRSATIMRASWSERLWARFVASLALTELYDVSFTPRRKL